MAQSHRWLLNALLFQVGWLVCVLGGNVWALTLGVGVLLAHWVWVSRSAAEWRFIFVAGLLGFFVDSAQAAVGSVRFSGAWYGMAPWLLILWWLFLSTLHHALSWLGRHPALAALFGAIGGPFSYWAGIQLGAGQFLWPAWQALALMALIWALGLPVLMLWVKRHA